MKNILKPFAFIALVLLMAACSKPADKKAQLDDLKKQRDEINAKIKTLESELKINQTPESAKTVSVVVTQVKPAAFDHFLEVQGKVDGQDNIAVSAQMPATVTAVYVKEGDKVGRGQVLAQLDNNVLSQQIANMRQQVDYATNIYNKQKALWDQQIGSEIQYLTAKNNKESLEKNLAALNSQMEMSRIKSPISGSVEEVNLKVGQMASPGLPAVRVVNFANVKVTADIAESYAPKIKPGNKVLVYFPDFNAEVPSTLRFTSKYINPVNRTFLAEIKLGPSKVEYRANMIATVKINDYSNSKAITVPISIVKESSQGKYVFVAKEENGKMVARRKDIIVGNTYNGIAEITTGLEEGDKVITTGYNYLMEGQMLNVTQ